MTLLKVQGFNFIYFILLFLFIYCFMNPIVISLIFFINIISSITLGLITATIIFKNTNWGVRRITVTLNLWNNVKMIIASLLFHHCNYVVTKPVLVILNSANDSDKTFLSTNFYKSSTDFLVIVTFTFISWVLMVLFYMIWSVPSFLWTKMLSMKIEFLSFFALAFHTWLCLMSEAPFILSIPLLGQIMWLPFYLYDTWSFSFFCFFFGIP